jgi:hypothetical protein
MNWLAEIDEISNAFLLKFKGLTEEELNWKPNPNSWSIAQHIEHLIVINQTYFPVLAELKSGQYQLPFMGRFRFLVNFFGATVLNAVKPEQKKKIKTFPIWEPSSSNISGDILERFIEHQNELKAQITTSGDLIKNGAIISSPANKNIVYRLETAFDIIVAHEYRHLNHADAVLKLY